MKTKIIYTLLIFFYTVAGLRADDIKPAPVSQLPVLTEKQQIIIIPVEGEVGPAMAAFVSRAVAEGKKHPDALFVFKMDTFGGRVDSAFEIVDTLLSIPAEKSIAYVEKRAISAGALIALSCGDLVMKHTTTIGDCAPIMLSNEGPQMLGEKFQSPIRAKFRTLAKRNGYPEVLSEAMVSSDTAIYRIEMADGKILYMSSTDYEDLTDAEKKKVRAKKTVKDREKLLTMDDDEALVFGFSEMSVSSLEEMLEKKGIRDYHLITFEESWSEQLVRFITTITPVLMIIGFAGLYIEMQTPGFGVPGIAGILCLALVFFGQYLAGLANYTELLIVIIGILLLGVEMFVLPGFGIAGFAAIAMLAVGMILSLQNFVLPNPEIPWEAPLLRQNVITVFGSLLGSAVLIFIFLRYIFPKLSGMVKGPYLTKTLAQSHVDSDAPVSVSIGDKGIVIKPLRPAGTVKIGEELYDVVSDGEFVAKGESVVVAEIQANRIMVSRSRKDEQ
jgi:membrane-bound serine protease (ClpP class)